MFLDSLRSIYDREQITGCLFIELFAYRES